MNNEETTATPSGTEEKSNSWIRMLLSLGGGAFLGYVVIRWLIQDRSDTPRMESPGLLLLSLPAIAFFVILTHELGHVFGGWLGGQRFYMLVVGPIRIIRDLGGIRWQFNRSLSLAGGIALCLPSKLDHFERRRFLLVLMGPVASAMLAFGCWLVASSLLPASSLFSNIFTVTALLSAFIGFATIVPHQAGGFPSDGAQLLGIVRGGTDSEKLSLIILLQNLSMSGTRPRDWKRELLERATGLKSDKVLFNATANLMAYSHHLDCKQIDLAEHHLEQSLSNFQSLPKGMREGFALEAAYFWAYLRKDNAKATEWFERGQAGIVEPAARSRVEAAVAMLHGDSQLALQKIEQSRTQLKNSIDLGGAVAELEMLDDMQMTLDQQLVSS